MIYRIFDDMSQCSEQEIARLLPIVSPQRQEQALRYTHLFGQYCCLKSYEILLELLHEWSCDKEIGMPVFLYNEHGAPYLEKGPYFSISHCKQGIAVALSNYPIGIDIEGIRRWNEGLVRKTMNNEEQKLILSQAQPEWEFIRLWTHKEAYVKMQGTGIISDMHDILTNLPPIEKKEIVCPDKKYICTIVKKA
jgi:4'-phosphopantetheinyl transferase